MSHPAHPPPAVLIKVGGSIQDDPAQITAVMRDAAAAARAGRPCVVVHGGGKAISAAMNAAGLTPRFVAGQRYTDGPTLEIAERVLAETVNRELCAALAGAGARPYPLHSLGTCVLMASRSGETGKPGQPPADLGLVGRVHTVAAEVLAGLCLQGFVPVIAPVAVESPRTAGSPGKLNVNADLAAGTVARALRPGAFVLVSDTPGVRTDATRYAPELDRAAVAGLIASGVIDGGMLPKIQACLEAIDAGVPDVSIIDGRVPGALARALAGGPIEGTRLKA
ncbi:MAG: acetylglutamate kinase [Phycisphaerae bacterium]|nr:acetylglutamate kinase [Phycisphaerae bacterium]